ncbi:MAG: right-handed parallel beta-helix repeat-containing protein [Candidatus Delongbacteria bacterium]|nr:right-handed parallel beta-helix repeat-containing protein [Candidatus Delongbacteria bacterium]
MGIRFVKTPLTNDTSEISFCTITDGNANIWDDIYSFLGGGIFMWDYSKLHIKNNLFISNRAGAGSAVALWNSSPEISNNIFRANCSGYEGLEGSSGSATIDCLFGSSPIIKNNLIEQNWLVGEDWAQGAAIRLKAESNARIQNNIIRENYIISNGNEAEGIAMYIHSSDPVILKNLIYDNYVYPTFSLGDGGALWFYDSNAKVINNTIKTNIASDGGALYFYSSSPDFHNNIIRGNEATVGDQIYLKDSNCDPNFYHNNIEGGYDCLYGPGMSSFTGAWINNIDEDPKYEDQGNGITFDLATDSPCIDSGTLEYISDVILEEIDLLGNDRISGQNIDMGAVESFVKAPTNLYFENNGTSVTLNWDLDPLVSSYNIYYSDSPFGEFILLDTITTNSYQIPVNESIKFFYVISNRN